MPWLVDCCFEHGSSLYEKRQTAPRRVFFLSWAEKTGGGCCTSIYDCR